MSGTFAFLFFFFFLLSSDAALDDELSVDSASDSSLSVSSMKFFREPSDSSSSDSSSRWKFRENLASAVVTFAKLSESTYPSLLPHFISIAVETQHSRMCPDSLQILKVLK